MIWDAVVLGSGIYGTKVALELRALGLTVALLDPRPLMSGATQVNQQRIHAGFHYPRSAATAETAARNYRRFLIDHSSAVAGNSRHLYCIAADSKVGPEEYERVLDGIGAEYKRTYTPSYFAPGMIAQCYETQEKSFHIDKLRALLNQQLKIAGIQRISSTGSIVEGSSTEESIWVQMSNGEILKTSYLFNCTYANIDKIIPIRTKLRKEHVEVALIRVHDVMAQDDITVMDGPYWSCMKYPAVDGLHAFTHVKHGRHQVWNPPEPEPAWNRDTKSSQMLLDGSRYVPQLASAQYSHSMFATRVLVEETMEDDGRPVLVEFSEVSPRVISVLGSKFNSVFEIEDFVRGWASAAF